MPITRILLVDSHPMAAIETRRLLTAEPGFELVAIAPDWWNAVGLVVGLKVDVCVVDVTHGDFDPAIATLRLKQARPEVRAIVIAEFHDLEALERLLQVGINAFLLARQVKEELVPAVHGVMQSGVYLGYRPPIFGSPSQPVTQGHKA